MSARVLILMCVGLLTSCVSKPLPPAPSVKPEAPLVSAAKPRPKLPLPFLYEVTKNSNRSYLFGTVHMGVAVSELPDAVVKAFDQSRLFVGEFNFREANALSEFDGRRHAKDLREVLSEQEVNKLIERLQAKYPQADQELLKTLARFSTATDLYPLTQIELPVKDDSKKAVSSFTNEIVQSLDVQLLDLAIAKGKTVSFLDTPRMAGDALRCMHFSDDVYLAQIKNFIAGKPSSISTDNQKKKTVAVMMDTVKAYREGSANLIRLAGRSLSPKLHRCLLSDRNEEWVRSLERSIDTFSNVFAAVGVLHLEDDRDSLIRRLEKDGYSVKRVQ